MKNFINKHRILFLIIIILCILQALLTVGGESLIAESINYATAHNMKIFWIIFSSDIVMWLLVVFIVFIKHSLIYKIEYQMNNYLRDVQMTNVLNLDYKTFHEKEIGGYVSNFINDVQLVSESVLKPMFAIIELFSFIIFSIVMIGLVNWFILVIMITISTLTFMIPRIFAKKLNRNNTKVIDGLETFTSKTKNMLSCFDVIYNYNLFKFTKQEAISTSDDLEEIKYKKETFQNFNSFLLKLLTSISMIICLILIVILATRNDFEIGWILGLSLLIANFYSSSHKIIDAIVALTGIKPLLEKFNPKSSEVWNIQEPLSLLEHDIVLKNISLELNGKTIVENTNMQFEKNKNYAIIGASGAGKTTLFKIITLFYDNYNGDVIWDNKILNKAYTHALNKQICYISQDNFLFNTTIKDNIILDQPFDLVKFQKVIKLSGLEDFINDNNYNIAIVNNGINLSGGQKQRLVIARGLYHDKKIFLLDEATSAIDKQTGEKIELNLLNNKDFTVIAISHHLSNTIKPLFDKIYTIS